MKNEFLRLKKIHSGRVLEVRLNRPEVRNAFNDGLIEELLTLFTDLAKNQESYRAVVLRGEGKAFCGGGDLNWMKSSLELNEEENFSDCQRLTRMFLAMDRVPLPLIGVVHGFAIGGGVGLTSVCDHVLAETNTIFSLSEVKLGLVPACIGPFVLSKVGFSQCRSLFLSGERFAAEKALSIGLVHEVLPEEMIERRLEKLLQQILEGGPYAISSAKNLLHKLYWDLRDEPLEKSLDIAARALASLRVGPEGQEGLKAFLDKRPPRWKS
jgi:methylglutaconyl-CoA hydratase